MSEIPTQPLYLIPSGDFCCQQEIKKSRFICHTSPCSHADEAKAFVQKIKRQYPDARHHCWAFAAGAPDDSNLYGCGDDGEPAGTAGRPMLAQLAGGEIGEIAAVVVRYFGGTKLGTGGLVRAYSSSVAMALSQLPTRAKQALSQLWVQGPHHLASVVEHCAAMHQAEVLQRLYSNEVTFQLQVPKAQYQTLLQLLQNRSKGSLTLSPTPLS